MTNAVDHPQHYTTGKFETIDVIEDIIAPYNSAIGWCIANVIKYVSRAPHKNNLTEDLKKARWYLDRAIQHAERSEPLVVADRKPDQCCGGVSSGLYSNGPDSAKARY